MIRTKAKSLLLSIMLVLACTCFFACKEAKVGVDGIAFEEKSISLLVGEDYSPKIKILPSYATDRSYRLVASDETAISIEGGTITALKAANDVKLKVISNENENINDVISITIYAEPISLLSPTGLAFDGDVISFTDLNDANVSSYVLEVDGNEINIGNNTRYSFNNIVEKLGSGLFNEEVKCRVKAVGDDKIFIDSKYSEEISFTKLSSVADARVHEQKLYFTPVGNVVDYTITAIKEGVDTIVYDVMGYSGEGIDISHFTTPEADAINGAEYQFEILPKISGNTYNSAAASVKYIVLGQVKNLNINGLVISWDFVLNAQSYTLEIYKGDSVVKTYNDLKYNYAYIAENIAAGEYVCKITANSNAINVKQGELVQKQFKVLSAPVVTAANNIVSWADGSAGAEGYLVTIKNASGEAVVNNKFVIATNYDVSGFEAGLYTIDVIAVGNGKDVLSSAKSEAASWTILKNTTITVKNKVASWQDVGAAEYVFMVLDAENQEVVNKRLNATEYDLSADITSAGTYKISVQPKGSNNSFDAKGTANTNVIKLADATIGSLSNKQFVVNKVANGVRYKLEINKVEDSSFATIELNTMTGGNKFVLDDTGLTAGAYTAKVFVYGNDTNIFDADNNSAEYGFAKLETPEFEMSVSSSTVKIVAVESENDVQYKLLQNSANLNVGADLSYDISNLNSGDYTYKATAQAMGNNADILNSEISTKSVVVKKLATPTIKFNKNELTYTIDIDAAYKQYVEKYNFKLNGELRGELSVANSSINCTEYMQSAIDYTATVYAVATNTDEDGCDLVIDSSTAIYDGVSRLSGACDFKVEGTNLVVEPTTQLAGTGYNLTLQVGEDITLTGFTYSGGKFTKKICDAKYNIIDELSSIMSNAGADYTVKAMISSPNEKIISSSTHSCTNKLKVLGRVSTINKNEQTIEFASVAGATNYVAVVTLNGVDKYIDLADKYNGDTTKILNEDLTTLLSSAGVAYRTENDYSIKIIAVSDDLRTLPNKGEVCYEFKFLGAASVRIEELEGQNNSKFISITNDANAEKYYVAISQKLEEGTKLIYSINDQEKDAGEYTYIDFSSIADMAKVESGNITIQVQPLANAEGNYYNGKLNTITATKLAVPEITVVDGKLQWQVVNNAKQYNLTYNSTTIPLTKGVANFSVGAEYCVYDFDELKLDKANFWLQVDASLNSGNYLNSNKTAEAKVISKLPTLPLSLENGQLHTKISLLNIGKIAEARILVDGVRSSINITDTESDQEGISFSFNMLGEVTITISPTVLLRYNNMNAEEITVKLYSKDDATLNSSTASISLKGLLSPTGLDVTTKSTTNANGAITEIAEYITWSNPLRNAENVGKYEIVINYGENEYKYTSLTTEFEMPQLGAGDYSIKVRALAKTDGNDVIVNSKYCAPITITILDKPTGLNVQQGDVAWSAVENAEYYLVRVYSVKDSSILLQTQTNGIKIDLSSVDLVKEGIYGVTVQAMSSETKVLASEESGTMEVVRLPQVTEYCVDNGELYIKVHKFYTKAEIYITNKPSEGESKTYPPFIIKNDVDTLAEYTNFVKNKNAWSETSILDTYSNDEFYIKAKYMNEEGTTLSSLLAEGYSIEIKLFGNSETVCGILSGQISSAHNTNLTTIGEDGKKQYLNEIVKLSTPTMEVSAVTHGQILLNVPVGQTYVMKYFAGVDGQGLEGVHLYQVDITVGTKHTLYVADIVDSERFNASSTALGISVAIDNDRQLKYFECDGKIFNIIDKINKDDPNDENDKNYIPFNFNSELYSYYSKDEGGATQCVNIDLSVGGSFITNATFIGDDSRFVQSGLSKSAIVKRYKSMALSTSSGNLSWESQATDHEKPLYIIQADNEATGEVYKLALYKDGEHDPDTVKASLDGEHILVPITYNVSDKTITYKGLAEAIYNARINNSNPTIKALAGTGGGFAISIKAHHINGAATDIIPAQSAQPIGFSVLPMAKIGLNSGTLTWGMPYITTTGNAKTSTNYIKNYLLTISDSNGEVGQISLSQGMYNETHSSSASTASYDLPEMVGASKLQVEKAYTFTLQAVAADGETYINSMISTISNLKIHKQLTNVRIENETLKWDNSTDVEVVISFELDGVMKTSKPLKASATSSYSLPSLFSGIDGTDYTVEPGHTYYLKVRKVGNNESYISSFYSEKVSTSRLSTIAESSVVTEDGVLKWGASTLNGKEQSGTTYTLKYEYNGETSEKTLEDTSYSFEQECKDGGQILVSITAKHNNYLSSYTTNKEIYKLAMPSSIAGVAGTTTVEWNMVKDDNNNYINDYVVLVNGKTYDCSTNKWEIQGVAGTSFVIKVKAVSKADGGILVNGEYAEETIYMPSAVQAVTFDDNSKTFKWAATTDRVADDKYFIYYKFNGSEEVTEVEVTTTEQVGSTTYYVYTPRKVGVYTNIYVQIKRANALSSLITGYIGLYNFDLYDSGEGSDSNPYIIKEEKHLRNITYFLDANYQLGNNIQITGASPIIEEGVFSGQLNGLGLSIEGGANSGVVRESALFKNVEGAIFKNIQLSYFTMNAIVESANFALGILADYANNSTFEAISVDVSTITLNNEGLDDNINNVENLYVGALVGHAQASTFDNCQVDLADNDNDIYIIIKGDANTNIYIGGLAGAALDGSEIKASNVSFNTYPYTDALETQLPYLYVGALAGVANSDKITNTTSAVYKISGNASSNTNIVGLEEENLQIN